MIVPIFIPIDKETMEAMSPDISDVPLWRIQFHGTQVIVYMLFLCAAAFFRKPLSSFFIDNFGINLIDCVFLSFTYLVVSWFAELPFYRLPLYLSLPLAQMSGVGAAILFYNMVH